MTVQEDEILSTTRAAIQDSSSVLLAMDGFGEVFGLTWTIFHLSVTIESQSSIKVVCNEVCNASRVAKSLSPPSFNPSRSKCRKESEKQAILGQLQAKGEFGFESLRKAICQLLLDASREEIVELSKAGVAPPEYVASAWIKAGAFNSSLSSLEEAERCHEKAAAIFESLGHEDGLYACAELSLGEVLFSEREFKKAEVRLRRAFDVQSATVGSVCHPDALRAGRKLAMAMKRNGNLEDSYLISRQVYDACVATYGPGHSVTGGAAISLAVVQKKMRNFQEASSSAEQALLIFDKVGGDKSSLKQLNFFVTSPSGQKIERLMISGRVRSS